jgi:hypothetical protein
MGTCRCVFEPYLPRPKRRISAPTRYIRSGRFLGPYLPRPLSYDCRTIN